MRSERRVIEIPSADEICMRLTPIFGDEGLRLVLLFGSAASGRVHRQSDIDLAFLFVETVVVLALTNMVIRHLRTDNVDVVDLRRASPLLQMSAVKTGRLLYERSPGLFNEFCSLAFRMYADSKKLRDARAVAIRRFLEKRGIA